MYFNFRRLAFLNFENDMDALCAFDKSADLKIEGFPVGVYFARLHIRKFNEKPLIAIGYLN